MVCTMTHCSDKVFFGAVQAKGGNPFWVSQTQAFLVPLKTGELIKSSLERVTLLLDDLPGTRFVPLMHPREKVGRGALSVLEERGNGAALQRPTHASKGGGPASGWA